jgi:peptidyl-prolyl cis-trans isomerase A (cyclophilin A)
MPMTRTTLAAITLLLSAACAPKGGSPTTDPAAPDSFDVTMETTAGTITLRSRRAWAPHGVDRFHRLVSEGFYDDVRFFRVVPGFVIQFGLSGDPTVTRKWEGAPIMDDTVRTTNRRGTLVFARAGQNTRTSQLFFNLVDNGMMLDAADGFGFPPIAEITSGVEVLDKIFPGYGEAPDQGRIMGEGNAYLEESFPKLDAITTARVTARWP